MCAILKWTENNVCPDSRTSTWNQKLIISDVNSVAVVINLISWLTLKNPILVFEHQQKRKLQVLMRRATKSTCSGFDENRSSSGLTGSPGPHCHWEITAPDITEAKIRKHRLECSLTEMKKTYRAVHEFYSVKNHCFTNKWFQNKSLSVEVSDVPSPNPQLLNNAYYCHEKPFHIGICLYLSPFA